MSAIQDATKGKIQKYLTDVFGSVEIDRDGDFTLAHGSTRVFIRVMEFGDHAVVNVWAPVLMDVPSSPALNEYIAQSQTIFGHFTLVQDGAKSMLSFSHRLLGDFLDMDELMIAIAAVASTSDDVDDELQSRFGGRKFNDR